MYSGTRSQWRFWRTVTSVGEQANSRVLDVLEVLDGLLLQESNLEVMKERCVESDYVLVISFMCCVGDVKQDVVSVEAERKSDINLV